MNAKLVATLTLVLGITASVALGADKKAPTVAGTYKGAIEGEQTTAILKVNGSISIIVWPSADRPETLRGKWKHEGDTITAKLKDPTGDEGAVVFKMDGGDLMLVKVIRTNGEVEEHGAPQFKRNKRLADKGLAGVYVGWFDDEHLSVQVKPDGSFIVIPADDLNGGPIYVGKWKATKRGLRATVTSKDEEDEEESTVDFVTTATGLAIIKVVNGDGEVDTFGTRLKRQNQPGKKN